MLNYPQARHLEITELEKSNGSNLPRFLLKDPARLSSDQVIVTPAGLYLLQLADGTPVSYTHLTLPTTPYV